MALLPYPLQTITLHYMTITYHYRPLHTVTFLEVEVEVEDEVAVEAAYGV